MKCNRNWFALAVAGALIHGAASASVLDLQQSFLNPSPHANDLFGQSVSLSGGIALVGASLDGTTGSGSGQAYVFDAATGALLRTLPNPGTVPRADDFFGVSVSLSGTHALIGAQNDDTGASNAGSAYLFDITTGALSRTFLNPGPAPIANDNFGVSVSLSGTQALIGAQNDDTNGTNAGSAYLFDITNGVLSRTFLNPGPLPIAADNFGLAVAVSGNRALISAPGDDTGAMNSGAAYLFDTATGVLLYTFTNPTPFLNDMFGTSIALSATRALIGASQDDTAGFNEGAAYLYDLAGNLLQTLLIPTPVGDSEFLGQSVALSGDFALVGAGFRNRGLPTAQQDLGAAFLFDADTGAFLQEFVDTVPNINDRFGFAVALDGDEALIGAQTDLVGGVRSGQVFYYATEAVVPEPASIAVWVCLASICGAGAVVRRKLRAGQKKGSGPILKRKRVQDSFSDSSGVALPRLWAKCRNRPMRTCGTATARQPLGQHDRTTQRRSPASSTTNRH